MTKLKQATNWPIVITIALLATSIFYFAYQVSRFIDVLPLVNNSVNNINEHVPLIVKEASLIRNQIPVILNEVKQIRELANKYHSEIPEVLLATNQVSASVNNVVELSENHMPNILKLANDLVVQTNKTTQTIENIVPQIPEVLARVDEVNANLPLVMSQSENLMGRAEVLVKEASLIGEKTSEGAVSGVFTGILKSPKVLLEGISSPFRGKNNTNLTDSDKLVIATVLEKVWTNATLNKPFPWLNNKTGNKGTITLKNNVKSSAKTCYLAEFTTTLNKGNKSSTNQAHICQNKDGTYSIN